MLSISKAIALISDIGWGKEEVLSHRIFGFNNPDPSPGSPNYGYEQWIAVAGDFRPPVGLPEGVTMKELPGGHYAALESPGIPSPEKRGIIVKWINTSEYQYDPSRQWLEEIHLNDAVVELLLGGDADVESFVFTLLSPVVVAGETLRT